LFYQGSLLVFSLYLFSSLAPACGHSSSGADVTLCVRVSYYYFFFGGGGGLGLGGGTEKKKKVK
jgi:hypothetical protein